MTDAPFSLPPDYTLPTLEQRRKEVIGDATLYLGDCRAVMGAWPTCFRADALVTDPPYGVGFTGKVTKHYDLSGGDSYLDTEENFRGSVLPAISLALEFCGRAAVFSGVRRLTEYPTPVDIGGIVCPNGGGRSPWGFGCFNPILFYGKSPYLSAGLGSRPTATAIYHPGMHVTGEREGNDHPCPKPIQFMEWAVNVASRADETVLDCFMGSGTTGVACARLGRRFIGIELHEPYFNIACRRLEAAYRQGDMFIAKPQQPKQEALL